MEGVRKLHALQFSSSPRRPSPLSQACTFSRASENNTSIGKHAQRIIDTSWNTHPNTHTRITREAPGIDSEANAGRGRWIWGLVGEIAAKKAGAVPVGPVYLQLHLAASTPMQYPILRMYVIAQRHPGRRLGALTSPLLDVISRIFLWAGEQGGIASSR